MLARVGLTVGPFLRVHLLCAALKRPRVKGKATVTPTKQPFYATLLIQQMTEQTTDFSQQQLACAGYLLQFRLMITITIVA